MSCAFELIQLFYVVLYVVRDGIKFDWTCYELNSYILPVKKKTTLCSVVGLYRSKEVCDLCNCDTCQEPLTYV